MVIFLRPSQLHLVKRCFLDVEYTSVYDHFNGLVPGKGDFNLKSWRFLGCDDNDHLFHGLAHYTKVDGRIKETSHLYHWLLLERGSKKYYNVIPQNAPTPTLPSQDDVANET